MLEETIKSILINELEFTTARSGGPGGQNVNKVESKVILKFNINNSLAFNSEMKERIKSKLKSKLTEDEILILSSQLTRSQLKNKEVVVEKFFHLLEKSMIPTVPRKRTRPPAAVKEKRLKDKNIRSEIKEGRKKISE